MLLSQPVLLLAASSGEAPVTPYVRDLLVVLLSAAAVSIVSRRIRLPSIPGYLIFGALVGWLLAAFGPGREAVQHNVNDISNIAIILLMFIIGLHMDTDAIRGGMVSILTVGLVSTLLVVAAGWPIGMAFGLSAPVALVASMALSISSSAVVLGLLQQRREVHRVHGRLCIGIGLMQDLISVAVLAVLPPIAVWAGTRGLAPSPAMPVTGLGRGLDLLAKGSLALGGIGVMVALGRTLLPRVLREASRGANTEALLVVSSTTALAAAVATALLGLGPALGAFVAGFLLAGTPFKHQLAGQLAPMRDLFMAVFFTAVGIQLDLGAVAHAWWVIGLSVIAIVVLKAALIGATTWAGGAPASIAVITGFALAQGGEFSLVIIRAAAGPGLEILPPNAASTLIAIVVVSLIVATPLYDLGKRLAPRFRPIPPARWITNPSLHEPGLASPLPAAHGHESEAAPQRRHVIIAGFGVVGRNIAEHFAAAAIPYTVVELNPTTVVRQQKLGRTTVYGDIANPDVLESAGVKHAEAVIITIPDDDAVLRACQVIRELSPDVFIAARTSYLSRAIAATEMGADHVTVEEVVTAQDMARQVMSRLAKRQAARERPPVVA